jgi:predicted dehydrogenase
MKRLGVIGYGARIRHMLDVIDQFNAGTEVVAVVDPAEASLRLAFPERLEKVRFYDDAESMLDEAEPDGVMIGTRCAMHTPYAKSVLARNLPLFLEKPVAISWEQLRDLRSAAEASSSPVVVSFPLRVSHLCGVAREIIDAGVIGTVEHVQAVNNVPFYSYTYYHRWMRDEAETGGLWLQKATHDFDYLTSLIRQRPVQIAAMESKTVFTGDMPEGLHCVDCPKQVECPESPYNLFYLRGITPEVEPNDWLCSFAPDTGNHDSATAMIRYESGLHMVYSQCFYTRRGAAKRGANLIGYQGTVAFDWYQNEVTVHHHMSGRVERHRFEESGGGHHGGDTELAHDFLDILNGTGPSRTTLADGLFSAALCLTARDSCQANTFEDFDPLGQTAEAFPTSRLEPAL